MNDYTLEDVKSMDSYITRNFLQNNSDCIRQIIEIFQSKIARLENLGLMYLKGGNGYSLLREFTTDINFNPFFGNNFNNTFRGDFDFQFVPTDPNAIERIDSEIIKILTETISEFSQINTLVNLNAFSLTNYDELKCKTNPTIRDGNLQISNHHYSSIKQPDLIGPSLKTYSTQKMNTKCEFHRGRVIIDPDDMVVINDRPDNCFRVYVNYSIPEFILYRLVYCASYNEKKINSFEKKEDLKLKSEIIDISVPRTGSAERLYATNGVITNFKNVNGCKFLVPGWGYHFYENLNLYLENELKISNSPQKRSKRIERGGYSLKQLIANNNINNFGLLKKLFNAPIKEDATSTVISLGSIFNYSINEKYFSDIPASAEALNKVKDLIFKSLGSQFESYLITEGNKLENKNLSNISNKEAERIFEIIAQFIMKSCSSSNEFQENYADYMNGKSRVVRSIGYDEKKEGSWYKELTPNVTLYPGTIGIHYFVIAVNPKDFQTIKNNLGNHSYNKPIINENYIIEKVSSNYVPVYSVILIADKRTPAMSYKHFIENMILVTERYVWQKIYEKSI